MLDLAESVADAKADKTRLGHFLEPALQGYRARAARLREHPLRVNSDAGREHAGHDSATDRALLFHQAVARRLDRESVHSARSMLRRLRDEGRMHPRYADRWKIILDGTLNEIKREIVADTEQGNDLRQNSPFAGALSEPERREVLRQASI